MPIEVDTILKTKIIARERELLIKIARQVIRFTLKYEEIDEANCEVSVVFTDDDFIAELNKQHRDEAGPTDVLSFPMIDFDVEGDELDIPGVPNMLGDIVISLDTAAKQAELHDKTFRQELALLLVHGTLHLLGYDHGQPQKEAIMWARQDEIISALNI